MNAIATNPTRFIALTFLFLFVLLCGKCQVVSVAADSSRIVFPNNVIIQIRKSTAKSNGQFTVDKLALKTLLVQCNYLTDQTKQFSELSHLLTRELRVKDSVNQILRTQIAGEEERVKNFSSAYDEMRSASAKYDKQMRSLINELESLKKTNRKARRRSFVKGMLFGIGPGIVVGAFVLHGD